MKKLWFGLLFFNAMAAWALTPIQDESMALVSGQAGISVDISSLGNSHIGEVRYETTGGASGEESASISLLDIDVTDLSFSYNVDVTDAELIFELNSFAQTDILFGGIAFNYDANVADIEFAEQSTAEQLQQYYSNIASVYINDFTVADGTDISYKFGLDNAGNTSFLYSASLSTGSYFYLTYLDDGTFTFDPNNDGDVSDNSGNNYMSAKVTFDNFEVEDISIHAIEKEGETFLELTLASLTGGVAFEDITINNVVIGTVGMENVVADPVSYFRIQGK